MSLDLVPDWIVGDLSLTEYPYGVDADSTVDPGDPEARVVEMESMAFDGDREEVEGYGNRVYALTLYIEGASLGDVAQAEATLRRELQRPNLTLTHNPGDPLSVPSIYDVSWAHMAFEREDRFEAHILRRFRLTLTCAPFAKSAELTTVAALDNPAVITTATIDTCDSATGWTGTRGSRATVPAEGPTTAWQAGSVGVAELDSARTSPEVWTMTRTGSVDFTATPYLVAEVRTLAADVGEPMDVTAWLPGDSTPVGGRISLPTLSVDKIPGSSYFKVVYDASRVGVVPGLTFSHTSTANQPWQGLYIRNLSRTNVPPGTTSRQTSRVIEVGGTERTAASIHVTTDGESPLGLTLVHTSPEDNSGYAPPLQRWRTVGQTRTPDPTAFSGNYELINVTSWGAEVPTSALPEGGYVLVARMRAQTAGKVTVSWSTSTIFPDSIRQEGFTLGNHVHAFSPDQAWDFVPLAALTLPSVRTANGKVQIALQVAAAEPAVTLDEAWLFRVDEDCALTIVDTEFPHLWLDSPDTASSVPRVWVGDGRETKVHPGEGLHSMGTHILTPGGTAIFTATEADAPLSDAAYRKQWMHNAAELS